MNRLMLRQWPLWVWMFVFGFVGAIASLLLVPPDPATAQNEFCPTEHPRVFENVLGRPDAEDPNRLLQVLKTQFRAEL